MIASRAGSVISQGAGLPVFLLADDRTLAEGAAGGHATDPEPNGVTGPQPGGEGAVEHRKVAHSSRDLRLLSNGPDALGLQRRLGADQTARVPRALRLDEQVGLAHGQPPLRSALSLSVLLAQWRFGSRTRPLPFVVNTTAK